jgi:hypothetical protein
VRPWSVARREQDNLIALSPYTDEKKPCTIVVRIDMKMEGNNCVSGILQAILLREKSKRSQIGSKCDTHGTDDKYIWNFSC